MRCGGWCFHASVGCNYRLVIWCISWYGMDLVHGMKRDKHCLALQWKAFCTLGIIELGLAWIRQQELAAKSIAEG